MSIALELYTESGARENHPRVLVNELDASYFETPESKAVLIRGRACVIFDVVRNVQLPECEDLVDVLKIRPKLN